MNDIAVLWAHLQDPLFVVSGTPVSLARLVGFMLIVVGAWWVSLTVERSIRHMASRRPSSAPSVVAWARITRYLIWIAATFMGLDYIGIDLSTFALVGGAVGVGIGFGLQNIFSNFFSGIILLLEKTLKEGDFVDLQSGTRGHVREIGLRYTRITTNDEVDVIVPNSEFINGRVVNWTLSNSLRRLHIPFGVAYGCDKVAVRDAALRAAQTLSTTVTDERRKSEVWLVNMGDSALEFELVVWVGAGATSSPARVEAAYKWEIHSELVGSGIEIPFPQRDLHLRSGALTVRMEPSGDALAARVDSGQ
jgi:small-conductance mechanosensitive channel